MLEITQTLLETKEPVETMRLLMSSGMDSFDAANLVRQALATPIGKIKMQKLIIVWSEGLADENIEYDSWYNFNVELQKIANEHDADGYTGAYAKTKFQIVWNDGEVYEGRLDVNTKDDTNVGQHVLDFLKFHTGEFQPAHMSDEDYQSYLSMSGGNEAQQEARDYIAKYEIVI